ncbi:hypothetical protein CYLTODRAFT_456932 [Cylindrobasidium torrendii FP15055 ss-10]|uniref:Zn(2)-C6 fungal-type domain-containing protein n=1 Tax=Cylindrobasidium torrendii FP15055 ss-10 TaxID=1314674 RepID=A0A0D7B2B6_9AGAR|nr:hypothetical protein CYLTODRAFT_456932 [Cylindrobasidium torrendii FP15055 ss-10]
MSSKPAFKKLPKGDACTDCRRRKIRCDGVQPICGPCRRAHNTAACQYVDIRPPDVQYLEDRITVVKDRIKYLESTGREQGPVGLHASPQHQWWQLPEPPLELRSQIIDSFLGYAAEVGLFLNSSRFRASVAHEAPEGRSRPVPSLLSACYLWGIRFSRRPDWIAHEDVYLQRAISYVSQSMQQNLSSHNVLEIIQTRFLLASYFFASNKSVEGKYHLSVGLSLSVAAGLSDIRTSDLRRLPPTALPPPADSVEEGERIDACWVGKVLDICWSMVEGITLEARDVDTPWPLEDETYESGGYASTVHSSQVLHHFFRGQHTSYGPTPSVKEAFCKAVILWQRASAWSNRVIESTVGPTQANFSEFNTINNLLEGLKRTIPSPQNVPNRTPMKLRMVFVAQSLVYSGILELHRPFTSGDQHHAALSAATSILKLVCSAQLGTRTAFVNPIMGTVWHRAASTVLDDLRARYSSRRNSGQPMVMDVSLRLTRDALEQMQPFAKTCSAMDVQINSIVAMLATMPR